MHTDIPGRAPPYRAMMEAPVFLGSGLPRAARAPE